MLSAISSGKVRDFFYLESGDPVCVSFSVLTLMVG